MKQVWEEEKQERMKQIQKKIDVSEDQLGVAHEHAHKKREKLEEKCAVAQERWKEQKERTQERGKIAMNRIQFLKQQWEEKSKQREILRRKTKDFVEKNADRMKNKREKILGDFAHFIISCPDAFGDVCLKPYQTNNITEAFSRNIQPHIVRHDTPSPQQPVPQEPPKPTKQAQSEDAAYEQRKIAIERGKLALKKMRKEKDKLCKQAEIEVAHIEERKKQLQAEIEEERERVNKLNQMKVFQQEIIERRRKEKKGSAGKADPSKHAHLIKSDPGQKKISSRRNNIDSNENTRRHHQADQGGLTNKGSVIIPTVKAEDMSEASTEYEPHASSILTAELLKPLEPLSSLFNSSSSLKYSFDPSSLHSSYQNVRATTGESLTNHAVEKSLAPPNSYNNSEEISPLISPALASPHSFKSFTPTTLSPLFTSHPLHPSLLHPHKKIEIQNPPTNTALTTPNPEPIIDKNKPNLANYDAPVDNHAPCNSELAYDNTGILNHGLEKHYIPSKTNYGEDTIYSWHPESSDSNLKYNRTHKEKDEIEEQNLYNSGELSSLFKGHKNIPERGSTSALVGSRRNDFTYNEAIIPNSPINSGVMDSYEKNILKGNNNNDEDERRRISLGQTLDATHGTNSSDHLLKHTLHFSQSFRAPEKMSHGTERVSIPFSQTSNDTYLTPPNDMHLSNDSFDFDPIHVSPAYRLPKNNSYFKECSFDYDPRITVYDNGERAEPSMSRRLGASQPISIPSSAKPRDSIQLSSSHDPLISTSHSQLDSINTEDLMKPLEGLSSLIGKSGETSGTYRSSMNTNSILGSKLVDSAEINAMIKQVEMMDSNEISLNDQNRFLDSCDRMLSEMNLSTHSSQTQKKSDINRPLLDLSTSFNHSLHEVKLPPPPEYNIDVDKLAHNSEKINSQTPARLNKQIDELHMFEKNFEVISPASIFDPISAPTSNRNSEEMLFLRHSIPSSAFEDSLEGYINDSPSMMSQFAVDPFQMKLDGDVQRDQLRLLKTREKMTPSELQSND